MLIPIQCEYYGLEGISQLLNTIRLVQQNFNPGLAISGVLLTMYDSRLNLCRQVAEDAKEYFGAKVFITAIPRNVRLAEAPSFGKPILLYDVQSVGAKSYLAVAQELMQRVENSGAEEFAPTLAPPVIEPIDEAASAGFDPARAGVGGDDMSETKRLGRGLEALLGPVSAGAGRGNPGRCASCRCRVVRPNPYQPRTRIDEDRAGRAHGLDRGVGPAAAGGGAAAGRRLRADRRRASLARRPAARLDQDSGGRARTSTIRRCSPSR